jgi:hypothetical protein
MKSLATLLPAPIVLQILPQPQGSLALTWSALAGRSYQLQYITDLSQTNWTDFGDRIVATNDSASASNVVGPEPRRFYRVVGR